MDKWMEEERRRNECVAISEPDCGNLCSYLNNNGNKAMESEHTLSARPAVYSG